MKPEITNTIKYIGTDDKTIDLFESQYIVPNGISYNSYVIIDEKIAVMDSVDKRKTDEWIENLKAELGERTPDYLVVSHLEPDHSGSMKAIVDLYPDIKIVCSAKAKAMMPQFAELDCEIITKGEGDTLELGSHTLNFVTAPMVHWPEVIISYESSEKVLFSADAFGKFGALDADEGWS